MKLDGSIIADVSADPFDIDGPAMISFSGGRTSAYMLRRMLDIGVQRHVHVLFANTGKEREETLDFVHEIETTWGVGVHWIEFCGDTSTKKGGSSYREVTYETASRHGEPFEMLIQKRSYLPNPVTRFCTTELKIRPMRNWMRAQGYDDGDWTNIVGIRADEPRRVARMRGKNSEVRWDCALPLADAGITVGDVTAFWNAQPFDLRLQSHEGNCDLCFLKGLSKKKAIIRDEPKRAIWWASQEAAIGAAFRKDQPGYAAMMAQPSLALGDVDEDLIECNCTD